MQSCRFRLLQALVPCALLATMPAGVRAEHWSILEEKEGTEVIFHSKATMESFDGRTRNVGGWINLDPANLPDGVTWDVQVQMASLQTGIGLRDKHMRENHLHTEEHPTASFQGGSVRDTSATSLSPGKTDRLTLVGQLTLHGVTREREIPVDLTMRDAGALEVEAHFEVSLADHDIPLPKFLVVKLADRQEVEVHLLARQTNGEQP